MVDQAVLPPGKNPVPILQEAGWVPGPVWTGAEILAPAGIRSPDRSARSELLYRLSYPSPHFQMVPSFLLGERGVLATPGVLNL